MTERTSIRSLTCFMFVPIVNVYIFVVIFIIVNRGYGKGYIERSTTGRNVMFLRSYTMHESLNQNVSSGLFLKSEVNNYFVSCTAKAKKENKNIQQGTLSAFMLTATVFILQSVADLPSEYWQIQRLVKFLKVITYIFSLNRSCIDFIERFL